MNLFSSTNVLTYKEAQRKFPKSQISTSAIIHKGALIGDRAVINGYAQIFDGADIGRGVVVCDNTLVGPRTKIGECSTIYQYVQIGDEVVIHSSVKVGVSACIGDNVGISDGAKIMPCAHIGADRKEVFHNLVILGFGDTCNITAYKCTDGLIVNIGCVNHYKGCTVPEMRKELAKKYNPDNPYFSAMDLIALWYNHIEGYDKAEWHLSNESNAPYE